MGFEKIAVFGLGLLGGSVCRKIKSIKPDVRISAYGRDIKKLEQARGNGPVDFCDTMDRASLEGIDLAIVSTPVVSSMEIIKNLLSRTDLKDEAIIIDVGSVKAGIIRAIEGHPSSSRFIGCHPMAGSEKIGYNYSRPDLYEGASVIITPHKKNLERDIERIKDFWEMMGANVFTVSPEMHDLCVTYTSHLPHIISAALMRLFESFASNGTGFDTVIPFIGNGFRDVTRIASSSPEMWRDIVELNPENISDSIGLFIDELDRFRKLISDRADAGSIEKFFTESKNCRDRIK
ncbi:MAG: prephenate dehydrogenase [Spirochaetes bacterium]|jgi:prephenate dehydrogenase|nr:prephenate dehydrogenase [Spirochaetota bacterium]